MPTKIQKLPDGLLNYLSIYSTGKNPDELLDEVRAIVDLSGFYASRRLETVDDETVGATIAGGYEQVITVPQGESWNLHNITVKVSGYSATTTSAHWALMYRPTSTGTAVAVSQQLGSGPNWSAGQVMRHGYQFARPVLLPPASSIIATAMFVQAGTATVRVTALIERLTA